MAATIRRIAKRSPAQFSFSLGNDQTYLDLNEEAGNDAIWIFSEPISSLFKAKSYTIKMTNYYSYEGEVIYIDDDASGSQVSSGGVVIGRDEYNIPAGSYFSFYRTWVGYLCSYYTTRDAYHYAVSFGDVDLIGDDDYDPSTHNKCCGIYYAKTDVVIIQGEDEFGNYSMYLESGTVNLLNLSVTHSTSSYSYWSQDNSIRYAKPFFSGINFFDCDNTTPLNIWQYYEQYAYLPVASESMPKLDPTSVALSNTSPVVGSSNSIVVTRSTSSLTYGTLTYTYQYSTNGGTSWTTLGTSTNTSYGFTVPSGVSQIKVRVQASDGIGTTSANYVTSTNYTVSSYTSYAGISGTVKGVSPKVGVSGSVKTNVTIKKGVNGTVK